MPESYADPAIRVIVERLAAIDGVVAVGLGGSHARGTADAGSDVDLGVYYRGERPPSPAALDRLARELDDRHVAGLVTAFGEWGPWINGGAWLVVGGRRVDWLYRDIGRVRAVIDDCRAGRVTCDYQPGHPHGFHNHIYMAEAHVNLPLHDPDGELASLRSLTEPYPEPMRDALIERFSWEAAFALDTAGKPAERGDAFHVSGSLFRCVACLVQVLFAVNREYFLNEKGAVRAADSFAVHPDAFEASVRELLAAPGRDAASLTARVASAHRLAEEVRALVPDAER